MKHRRRYEPTRKKKKNMTSPTDLKSMAILVRLSTRFVNSLREGGGSVKLVRRGAVGLLLLLVVLEA